MHKGLYPKGPAALFKHNHPPVRNANKEFDKSLTLGQHIADKVASILGSWPFIVSQTILLAIWMMINVYLVTMETLHPGYLKAWDPYPFILLNLVLSLQAAYTGPVVMMSQNRQADHDRMSAQLDYEVNAKAEQEIEVIMQHLAHQDELIQEIINRLDEMAQPNNE